MRPRLLVLSRYGRKGASTRLRVLQYVPHLEAAGWEVFIAPLFRDPVVESLYHGQRTSVGLRGLSMIQRFLDLRHCWRSALVWIEKEMFPYLPAWSEWLLAANGIRYVVDNDDAIFHNYDRHSNWCVRALLKNKIGTVMRLATAVLVGNDYLKDYAVRARARRVELVPTVVDLSRYRPAQASSSRAFTVGWIGTPVTAKYLTACRNVFVQFFREADGKLLVIGAENNALEGLPVESVSWNEDSEVEHLRRCDVGIMPLPDEPFERGKCGYKLIQYMACGLPVVASSVGINRTLVEPGVNGYLASSEEEWLRALRILRADSSARERLGSAGRRRIEENYCLQVTLPKILKILSECLRY